LKVVPHDKNLFLENVSSYESLLIEQETNEKQKSNLEKVFQEKYLLLNLILLFH